MPDLTPDRRDFLAAGAATIAAAGVVGNAFAAGDDRIRVGVIGCGGRGTQAAENVLSAAPNVQVIAIADAFPDRVNSARGRILKFAEKDETCKKYGNTADLPEQRCFHGLDAYEKVLALGEVNYVILATPPGFRPQHLEAAVAAGKHIFTEKPVSVDAAGTRRVLDLVPVIDQKKLGLAAGTQRRHQLGYVETIKQIHDGAIGDIVALRCYWNGQGIWFNKRQPGMSDVVYQMRNWYHFLWLCGDHIVEQHVHNLDVCNWAMKAHPIKADGAGGRLTRPVGDPNEVGHIFDNFSIDYEYPGGVHMYSSCRHIPGCTSNVSEALVGTKGTCQANAYSINGKSVVSRSQDRASANPYVQEHTDLIESIRAGKPLNELKDVAESTLTAIMGRMAAYTGKTVTWEQALNSKEDTFPRDLTFDMSLPVGPVPVPGKTPLI